jgi:hypothetical protein
MEKSLTVHSCDFERAAPMLGRAAHRTDTTGGTASLAELCQDGNAYELRDSEGRQVGAYVLAMRDHAAARVAWVMAAGGAVQGVDLTGAVLPCVERQARTLGAGQVAITTRRPGLIRKLKKQGYSVTGVTLRKTV